MKIEYVPFVPPKQSLSLKELGFDEPCFGRYYYKESYPMLNPNSGETELVFEFGQYIKQTEITILAPLYQQAFRFFREEYKLLSSEVYNRGLNNNKLPFVESYSFKIFNLNNFEDFYGESFKTYEEAESARIDKLIEIVKTK
jgi:hypothetical protein